MPETIALEAVVPESEHGSTLVDDGVYLPASFYSLIALSALLYGVVRLQRVWLPAGQATWKHRVKPLLAAVREGFWNGWNRRG